MPRLAYCKALFRPKGQKMARPRVFVSSTFYDLRQVREDLERAIREIGFEPVRHETGRIPYAKDDRLESSAYREVELCDIVVSVIGGRFGTGSTDHPGMSISQVELKKALERGIQVFIFVERSVLAEYSTYQLNNDNLTTKYRFVDDNRVYAFIEEIYALPHNNPITAFETSADITDFLRLQWAGLFHRFIQDQKKVAEINVLAEMTAVAQTLRDLVSFLTEERKGTSEAVKTILLMHHPAFRRLQSLLNPGYRVFFTDRKEMCGWLRARGWSEISRDKWDADSVTEWQHQSYELKYLKFTIELFDASGALKGISPDEWNDSCISIATDEPVVRPPVDLNLEELFNMNPSPTVAAADDDDNVPF